MWLRMAVFALLLGSPALAAAEEFPESALGLEVRGDEGTILSRIEAVERDGQGRIVAVEAPGLEPADAPAAGPELFAAAEPDRMPISLSEPGRAAPALPAAPRRLR